MKAPHTYSETEIAKLKEGGAIHSQLQKILYDLIHEGQTGMVLDVAAEKFLKANEASSAFKGFKKFPKHICISINDQLIHGIPNDTYKFKHGDIVSIDIGVRFKKLIVDGAFSVVVSGKGKESELENSLQHKLVLRTREALKNSLQGSTKKVGDFCRQFDEVIKEDNFFLTEDYAGHGVGRSLHEEPSIPNSPSVKFFYNWKLKNGMVIAIEPMVFEKKCRTLVAKDKWAVVANNKSLSAHFEETITIINDKIVSLNPFVELTEKNLIKS